MPLRLVVSFRGKGWRWPLDGDDLIEVWTDANTQVAEVPGALLILLLQHYLQGASLEATLRQTLAHLPDGGPALPPPPTTPRLRGTQGRMLKGRP